MKIRKASPRASMKHQDAAPSAGKPRTARAVKNKPALMAAEQLRLLDELRESEARFHLMAEVVPVLIYTTTPAGETDYVNQRLLHYTGLTAEQLLSQGLAQALHPADRQAV
ncbi:MAG TPA: hypothetical protein DDZ88_03200, partial [Verrucomicrobiales bacterium]|nr:hypothetical protein [Verrucomicrobiales bacterium]